MAGTTSYISVMDRSRTEERFLAHLQGFQPEGHRTVRALSLYSAVIALADPACLSRAGRLALDLGATPQQLYETVLQSYLFLGFPRMLTAAECLHKDGFAPDPGQTGPEVETDMDVWRRRGQDLCRRVYQGNYAALKKKVEAMAPEIFFWMELEGYGKVLARPGLDLVSRETAIVACLVMDNRPVQLHSHLRGALNVGASGELLREVAADLEPVAPEGAAQAHAILTRLGVAR